MGSPHSLTLIRAASGGSRLIMSSAHASAQPQSQTMRRGVSRSVVAPAADLLFLIPSRNNPFNSAMTSAGERLLQRGQFAPALCDQQLVRFSEALMVKSPPRSGTARQMVAIDSTR